MLFLSQTKQIVNIAVLNLQFSSEGTGLSKSPSIGPSKLTDHTMHYGYKKFGLANSCFTSMES